VTRLVDASRIERQTALLTAKTAPAGAPGNAEVAKLVEERLSETGLKVWNAGIEGERSRPLRNLFALLPGRNPAARPVLLGAHLDVPNAEGAGAASNTSIILEAAEVLAEVRAGGWQPERNVLFAFWGGGEGGLPGSTAWVEQALRDRNALPVAYVDVGPAADGRGFLGRMTPGLRGVLDEVLRAVPDPESGKPLAEGKRTFPLPDFTGDAAPFLGLTTTPVVQLGCGGTASVRAPLLARLVALFAGTLASDPVLPYRFTEISDDFRSALRNLEARSASANDWVGTLPGLEKALDGFEEAARRWDAGAPRLRRLAPQKAQAANQLLERAMGVFAPAAAGSADRFGHGSLLVGPEPGNERLAVPHASLARALRMRNFDAIREEASERTRALTQAKELLRAAEWIALGPGRPVRPARTARP
jgi:hypothetical protein